MKKIAIMVISIMLLLFCFKVEAKDTVCTLNKYKEEELNYILQEEKDNFIVSGIYKDKDDILKSIIINYNSKGTIQWKYQYQGELNSEVKGLIHNYNNEEENYLLVIKEENESPKFLVIDKEGTLKQEVKTSLPANTIIEKVIEVGKEGFLIAGQKESKAFISKFDNNLNQVWSNDYSIDDSKIVDIIYIDNHAYYGIIEKLKDEKETYELLKYDLTGKEINTLKTDFEEEKPQLLNSTDSYIVYGTTKEVKLSKNKIGSYYLIKYNLQDVEEWETVGDTPTTSQETLKLHSDGENYYVMSTNDNDSSIEVVKIDKDGVIKEKIKKLKTSYYKMNDFIFDNDNLYFIGQINCPENDNCDYNANSLFLVCSEDKVIEVKDNDSKNIMVGTLIIVGFIIILYIVKKKKKLSINK